MPISLYAYLISMPCCYPDNYPKNQNILEVAFEGAFERAKELDRYYEQHHKIVGPLHGLPFSMKDQWHVKGLDTSMAYVGWIGTFEGRKGTGKEKTFESELVRELSALGAILVAKVSNLGPISNHCSGPLILGEDNISAESLGK